MGYKKWYEKKEELKKLVNENSGKFGEYELKNGEIYCKEQRINMNAMSIKGLNAEIKDIKNAIGIK